MLKVDPAGQRGCTADKSARYRNVAGAALEAFARWQRHRRTGIGEGGRGISLRRGAIYCCCSSLSPSNKCATTVHCHLHLHTTVVGWIEEAKWVVVSLKLKFHWTDTDTGTDTDTDFLADFRARVPWNLSLTKLKEHGRNCLSSCLSSQAAIFAVVVVVVVVAPLSLPSR